MFSPVAAIYDPVGLKSVVYICVLSTFGILVNSTVSKLLCIPWHDDEFGIHSSGYAKSYFIRYNMVLSIIVNRIYTSQEKEYSIFVDNPMGGTSCGDGSAVF